MAVLSNQRRGAGISTHNFKDDMGFVMGAIERCATHIDSESIYFEGSISLSQVNRIRAILRMEPLVPTLVRFPAMRANASADPSCTMCGAVHGMPHHDPDSAGVIVDLVDAETPSGKAALLCQTCKAGVDEIRGESSDDDGEAEAADLKLRGLQEDGEL